MKTSYILAAAVVVLILKKNRGVGHGRSTMTAAGQVLDEAVPVNGSDFQGSWWDRLHGSDIVSAAYPNLLGSVNADPGPIGVRQIVSSRPQLIAWNGDMVTAL